MGCCNPFPAHAEDCYGINVDSLDMDSLRNNNYVAAYLTSRAPGIFVEKYISNSGELTARVRLTITRMDIGQLLFDKNYGFQSGIFRSEDIYLPYGANQTVPYLVTLYVENWVYAFPYIQLMPRLTYNGACTYGARMSDYNPALAYSWLMGTMLDLDQLRAQGAYSVPICASNAFIVGEATVSLLGEQLSVALRFYPEANVELHQAQLFCVTDVTLLHTAEPYGISQRAYQPGETIDVSGARSALLYLPLSISYDSVGLGGFAYDLAGDAWLNRQLSLWHENFLTAREETQMTSLPGTEPGWGDTADSIAGFATVTKELETAGSDDGTDLLEFQPDSFNSEWHP